MKKRSFYALAILISILIMGIGYAAISSLTLSVGGTASATSDSDNFDVRFIGTPTTGGVGTTIATIDANDTTGRTATINVSDLTTVGDKATATYTISNNSTDINAALSAAVTQNTNSDYFNVSYTFENTTLNAQVTTTIVIEVELLTTPITDQSSNISIEITAIPENPTP